MSIKQYLPSKKFSIFIGVACLVGVVIFTALRFFGSKNQARQNIQNIATREIILETDTDGDGLRDWEEALWGMDKENPDTDGDGLLDGQEVESKRKDLKNLENYVEVENIPESETEKIARQVLIIATNIHKASGGNLSQEQIVAIAQSVVGSINPELINIYDLGDIVISTQATPQSYYNEMSQALVYLDTLPSNELLIIEHSIATKDKKLLKQLGPIIDGYIQAGEKVKDVQVPSQIAQSHLEYINALSQKAVALISMGQYFEDPIIASRGVEEYKLADEKLNTSSLEIRKYLQRNNVVR